MSACAVSPVLALDTELLNYVGPDAKAIAGIYVDRAVGSPLGMFLQSKAGANARDLDNFVQLTGFDPRRDVREVVMAAPSQDQKAGLIVARGVFNGAQLGAAALLLNRGTKETYNGVDLYRAGSRPGAPVFGFPEPSIGLMGDEVLVKAALDRRRQPLAIDPKLISKINTASTSYDAWFASTGQPGLRFGKAQLPKEALDVVSGGVTLGSVVQLKAEAVMRSEKDANSLVEVIRFVTGMLAMRGQGNPDMARAFVFLQNAQTSVDGSTVLFSTSVPQAEIERLLSGPRKMARLQ